MVSRKMVRRVSKKMERMVSRKVLTVECAKHNRK
jgi:hypothetical protein